MSEILYGRHPVREALRAGEAIERVLVAEGAGGGLIREILRLAKGRGVRVERVPRRRLDELTGRANAQGVVALAAQSTYASIPGILARGTTRREPPLVALLDGIEDPQNLGAILRAADGAGVHGVILPKRRAAGLTGTVAKTSAGAASHVPTAQVSNLNYTIDELKAANLWIVGADQEAEQIYYDCDFTLPVGIVIGGEGRGLRRLVREKCDFRVHIPMYGKLNSLNAAMAAALLFFEARRQRTQKSASRTRA